MARTEKTGAHPASDIEAVQLDRDNITSEKAGPRPGEYVENPAKYNQETEHIGTLERRLKSRHVQFLALSGAIGTGLFVGSARSSRWLALSRPYSRTLSPDSTSSALSTALAKWLPGCLSWRRPHLRHSICRRGFGFTLGWNYWYQLAIGVPLECTVCAVIIDYWDHSLPKAGLLTIFYVAMVIVNCFPVNIYGEAEFIFGAIKLTTIVGLILLMLIVTCGGTPTGEVIGFKYWRDPGPMNEPLGRFLAFWKVFIQATFSYGGSEWLPSLQEKPRTHVATFQGRTKSVLANFVVLCSRHVPCLHVCIVRRPELLNAISSNAPGANQSPFVIAIDNAKIKTLPGILNGIVLTSAWSAGNSFFYSSTRVLYSAALDGKAPAFLRYEKFGVPYGCVAMTSAWGF
ncbi:unnamed protein product [Clonostachys rosea f. rosea IK726]|uniref:Uncharacterized protein n=1 Tax=Clonostachys rosea f. rosea IK726 TaxID=1349383 RepID=A0ACA9UAS5_BIOOC|nr:unnamed protein product [Clonostachys rosea f. rosea IK726]